MRAAVAEVEGRVGGDVEALPPLVADDGADPGTPECAAEETRNDDVPLVLAIRLSAVVDAVLIVGIGRSRGEEHADRQSDRHAPLQSLHGAEPATVPAAHLRRGDTTDGDANRRRG